MRFLIAEPDVLASAVAARRREEEEAGGSEDEGFGGTPRSRAKVRVELQSLSLSLSRECTTPSLPSPIWLSNRLTDRWNVSSSAVAKGARALPEV